MKIILTIIRWMGFFSGYFPREYHQKQKKKKNRSNKNKRVI